MRAIVLDAGPLGLLANPHLSQDRLACREWFAELVGAGVRVVVPEIADYEVRRELLRSGRTKSIARLDNFNAGVIYLPLTTSVMRQAAML